jgi:hypothetical protein
LAKNLLIFFIFPKKQPLVSLCCSLGLRFIDFCPDFYNLSLCTTFGISLLLFFLQSEVDHQIISDLSNFLVWLFIIRSFQISLIF